MRVSIITISFNQARFLERNRASVAAQEGDIEHIIVDPGSTDGSRDLIRSWARERSEVVPLFRADRGPADGLNNGLSIVSGDVWLYLNSDDELAPDAIAKIAMLHQSQPDIDVVIGCGWTIDELGNPLRYIRSDRFSPNRYAMNVGTVLQQATSFKTRSTIPEVRFNPDNRANWDTEYLFDLYYANRKFGYSSEILGYFRLQPASITMSGNYEKVLLAERSRLRQSVRFHRQLATLGLFARGSKAVKSRLSAHTPFPGLASER